MNVYNQKAFVRAARSLGCPSYPEQRQSYAPSRPHQPSVIPPPSESSLKQATLSWTAEINNQRQHNGFTTIGSVATSDSITIGMQFDQ